MRTRLRKIWDSLRATYWFVPSFMMVLALVLWLITNKLDQELSAAGNKPLGWLYFADIESTRKLLFTIAGTVIGIVGVVFSILMVPLTIAATQFGPRLLRTFLRDTGTNVTLGTFTATFVFCVLVLLQLHEDKNWPLPQISVSTGLALGLLSFGMLVFFINHIATSIQASVLISEVNKELMMAIDHELPKLQEPVAAAVPPQKKNPVTAGTGQPVPARKSGYVHTRDDERLLRFAKEHDIVIKLLSRPGDFVVEDTPLALVFSNTEVPSDLDLEEPLNEAFTLGLQRTLV
ncbi:MAG TPA: DUF2254 domain-containing protein, partial [Adhaeribacter sp.]|nr:DUF2254 domain-containing protein [Adhaeribacter sp.]